MTEVRHSNKYLLDLKKKQKFTGAEYSEELFIDWRGTFKMNFVEIILFSRVVQMSNLTSGF